MGTWGTGIFENDKALDFAAEVTRGFVVRIETAIADDHFDVDRQGAAIVMPCVAFLTLLCERANAVPPKRAQIAAWRERYLARFDADYPGDARDFAPFQRDRRAVAEAAFRDLDAQAQAFWREDAPPPSAT